MNALITAKKRYAFNSIGGSIGKLQNILQWEYDNRWTKEGDIALVQKASTTNLPVYSAFSMSNANYSLIHAFRLQNVGIGYALPEHWTKPIGIKQLTIRADANNLLLVSDFTGVDPDVNSNTPTYRTVNFGLNCSL